MKTIEHRETIELAARDVELAVFEYLKEKMPADYDEFQFIGIRHTHDRDGIPMMQLLAGLNGLKVQFSYLRKAD